VNAGDDEEMEGPGAFEVQAKIAAEVGAISEEHGVECPWICGVESKEVWKPTILSRDGEGWQAGGCPSMQGFDTALEGEMLWRGVDVDEVVLKRRLQSYAFSLEILRVLPDTGVAIGVRLAKNSRERDAVAAVEWRKIRSRYGHK